MVREVTKYACGKCGLEGSNETKIAAHEQTPITGLDAKLGEMFKIKDVVDGISGIYVLVITNNGDVGTDHKFICSGVVYELTPNDSLRKTVELHTERPVVEDKLSELTDGEYQIAEQILHTEVYKHGIFDLSKGVIKHR